MDGLEDVVKVCSLLTDGVVGKGEDVEGPVVWGAKLGGVKGWTDDGVGVGVAREERGVMDRGMVEGECSLNRRGG